MSALTYQERVRMVKGFLMTSGGIALAMVLFALIGQLDLTTNILCIVGIAMVASSAVLALRHQPARLVYAMTTIGMAVVAGAVGGRSLIGLVLALLR